MKRNNKKLPELSLPRCGLELAKLVEDEPVLLRYKLTESESQYEPEPTLFTHMTTNGQVMMVDVGGKSFTLRRAVATGVIRMAPSTLELLERHTLMKGNAVATARVAGIMAAKRTWELIPLCHPLMLSQVSVDIEVCRKISVVQVTAEVRTTGQTGVEMEALTAVSVALLTLYDMCKAVQKDMELSDIHLLHKSGGRSGIYIYQGSGDSG